MKLKDTAVKQGTFAGIKLHERTEKAILRHIKKHNITNAIQKDDIHVTLLYSKKYVPDYKPLGQIDELAVPNKFTVFKSSPSDCSDPKNCLVLLLDSKFLHDRFEKLMKDHDATYDFKRYNPHVTFSYDVGDIDVNTIPKFSDDVQLIREYKQALHNT